MAHMWHILTSGRISSAKFEICVVERLFQYEVWRRLRQDLCVFRSKTASVMQRIESKLAVLVY